MILMILMMMMMMMMMWVKEGRGIDNLRVS